MSKSSSIPEELIEIEARKIWKKRGKKEANKTPEDDWREAKKYLEKHRWKVFWWKVRHSHSRDFALEIIKFNSIPEELIKDKARKIWEERQRNGTNETPEEDWRKAEEYLEKHRWKVFWWEIRHPQSRDFALEIIKSLGVSLTALGLLFALWEGLEDRRLTQERLITERFSKAVEQLGKYKGREGKTPDVTVRVGGIYALERIAKDSPKDHWTIMEVLTAYVRENSPLPPESEQTAENEREQEQEQEQKQEQKETAKLDKVRTDVQAVLTVIGRRKDPEPNMSEKVAQYISEKIDSEGREDSESNISETIAQAVLTVIGRPEDPESNIHETIDLSSTNLSEASLYRANLQSADLRDANLQSARLNGANLQSAELDGANLQSADLRDAKLQSARLLSAKLQSARLLSANLQSAYLRDANLQSAYLGGANLQSANLLDANLQSARLLSANLQSAYLRDANLQSAYLRDANLQSANLLDANLQSARLLSANLQSARLLSANLQSARLLSANLQSAYLRDANLQSAYLGGAENLTPQQIKSACNWENVIYKGEWDRQTRRIKAIEPDNTNYIKELKQDKASNPKEPPDCSEWSQ